MNPAASHDGTPAPSRDNVLGQARSLAGAELLALVRADQRRRWQSGQRPPVEAYLDALPELDSESDALLDLVLHEFLLREERGEAPQPDEFFKRFPLLQTRLQKQFALHRAAVHDDSLLGHYRPVETPEADANGKTRADGLAARATAAAAVAPWPTVPGYVILEELGRGGMGVVYKAWQEKLKRTVALKMILFHVQSEPEHKSRFLSEAEAVARLQHPGIVQVHEIGEHDGRPYFALEYLGGGSLEERLAGKPLRGRPAAQLVEALAGAMHYAHQRGIVHRDLKPANILIAECGLRISDSEADIQAAIKITDFGLAKQLHEESARTHHGDVLGTPSYMAPEQAAGRNHDITPATDVYALGAILYQMLTGRAPFCAHTPQATIVQVLEQDPVPPRLLNAHVDRDLEVICMKCLQKAPRDRYASAKELADDLARYRRGEPVSARSMNLIDRLVRALERSQDDMEFHNWSPMLLGFGIVVFLAQLWVAGILSFGPVEPLAWLLTVRALEFVGLAAIFYRYRSHALLPRSAAERQLWAIWVGYIAATAVLVLTNLQLARSGKVADELTLYPLWSALSGLAFFVMGSSYWGRLYVVGLGFFALAIAMPFHLDWAPLEFGILWCAALVGISVHLRHLERAARNVDVPRPAPPPSAPPDPPVSQLSKH